MCSVVGYVGARDCVPLICKGLRRLEYRGYDSAGIAYLQNSSTEVPLTVIKTVGDVAALEEKIGTVHRTSCRGIGHTRWATHGDVTDANAHPHTDCYQSIAVVHNGMVENFQDYKKLLLEKGHSFSSSTDTEVIAHIFEFLLEKMTVHEAAVWFLQHVHGAYACALLFQKYPFLLVIRKKAPLCVGIAADGAFVASDQLSFSDEVTEVMYIPDDSFALVLADKVQVFDNQGAEITARYAVVTERWTEQSKGTFSHYMLKEMHEQRGVIYKTALSLQQDHFATFGFSKEQLHAFSSVVLLGCGSSYYACQIAEYFFETIVGIPARAYIASEFRTRPCLLTASTLTIVVSQSGETADTLEAMRKAQSMGSPVTVITNVISSSMARETWSYIQTCAGPEIAVASTKAFSAQVATLYLLAQHISYKRDVITSDQYTNAWIAIRDAADALEGGMRAVAMASDDAMSEMASFFHGEKYMFIGRHVGYGIAQEAALKLKEISYAMVDCYPAGELKHGAIALLDATMPVVLFSSQDPEVYQKLVDAAQQVVARGAPLLVFVCGDNQQELSELATCFIAVPETIDPLLVSLSFVGAAQMFAYTIAHGLGRPIDRPRNLAKSVTVE